HVQVRVDIGLTRGERAADQHAQKIRLAHGVPADGLQPPSVKRECARPGGKGEGHRRALQDKARRAPGSRLLVRARTLTSDTEPPLRAARTLCKARKETSMIRKLFLLPAIAA